MTENIQADTTGVRNHHGNAFLYADSRPHLHTIKGEGRTRNKMSIDLCEPELVHVNDGDGFIYLKQCTSSVHRSDTVDDVLRCTVKCLLLDPVI